MATIGRHKAVADLNFVHLSGLPAWLVWLFVHIVFLVGFRNRLAALLQWALGLFHIQCRRAIDHAELPIRTKTAGLIARWRASALSAPRIIYALLKSLDEVHAK
jgi:hypothetical protein